MNISLMQQALHGSLAGELTFPQVLGLLTEAGVESYRVDFITGQDVFYLSDGQTHTETISPHAVAPAFDHPQLKAAIRGAQQDRVRYPEFVQLATAAGVAAYHVFLNGRRALYFGRSGDIHAELFPQPK